MASQVLNVTGKIGLAMTAAGGIASSAMYSVAGAQRAIIFERFAGIGNYVVGEGLSIIDKIFDGFFNATPKRRTPLEKRLRRRYGDDNWINGSILLKPKRNIIICGICGSHHEAHTICLKCYDKVRKETAPIIESIRNAQSSDAVTREVVVRYKDDLPLDDNTKSTKQIVETERTRPLWFADNLVQRKASPGTNIEADTIIKEERVIKIVDEK